MNDSIGRCGAGGGSAHLTSLERVRDWCDQHGVLFKVMVIVISSSHGHVHSHSHGQIVMGMVIMVMVWDWCNQLGVSL